MLNPTDDRSGPGAVDIAREIGMRRKWVGLAAFAAVLCVFVSLAIWLPDLYRATTSVLVESHEVSEELVRRSVTSELETRLERIRHDVMSRSRLLDLIRDLDLYQESRSRGVTLDTLIERMRRDIDLDLKGIDHSSARGPTIAFAISYTGRDPETVARVANVLASVYVEENTKLRAGQAARAAAFLKTQLDEVKRELDEQERRTSDYKLGHLGELPQQVEANLSTLDRLNTQLRLNSENQIRALERRDRLEKQLADASVQPVGRTLSPRASQLAKLKEELVTLRKDYSDAHPEIARVKREIGAIEQLERDSAEPVAPVPDIPLPDSSTRLTQAIDDVSGELRALKEEEIALRQVVTGYERRVENVPKRQEEYLALSRHLTTTKERHDGLLKRYEEAHLAASLEQGQQVERFRILDAATPPEKPAAPGRLRLILLGIVLAFGAAAASMLAMERLDTSFHSVDDLRTSVRGPVVFSIPTIASAGETQRRWRRRALTATALVAALILIIAGVSYVADGNERIVRLVARGQV